ncbi:hypothetical protein C8A00DRAFT_30703 [Chaetomidium leptoderma]|uniref:DUF1917-domain-containing protein n=1 Tax=Chaetomidium leptoderma TaxID=669021 RepID=A0AAN6VRS7_9PEZI|nr:hypothetical protein C8A00DRAFT_30703 [Chaetomidium leptoderma]
MDSDSDFYGDEETTSALEARVNDFDIVAWWNRHNTLTTHLHRASHNNKPVPTSTPAPDGSLHNHYESQPGARQLSESIEHFLARLPPATTDWRPGLDWIWIANPHTPPPGPGSRALVAQFRKGGEERLALFTECQNMATATAASGASGGGRSLARLRKDVADGRREAVADLRDLAGVCNVVTGKWMLFPEPGNVNEVWAKVCQATANDELGTGAKVETRVESAKERLICVYTRDFRDKDDVARVLNRMRELELVRPGGKQIYYKSDAWTELGIYGGNNWGIGASTYSSNEIFGYIKTGASRRQ